ncbi:MAG: porin [Pseudomonadota bacterium]|nr:porin [Pseudomonadota bacterium]
MGVNKWTTAGAVGLTMVALGISPVGAATDEEIDELRERLERTEQRLDATVSMLEAEQGSSTNNVHIGGYGELHYNYLEGDESGEKKREIDFHRFVLFFGYDFSDRIRFKSEVELEHAVAGDGQEGEVELEQAYVEFDLAEHTRVWGGLFLLPVGILNETHEPPTFFGVERNPVEKNIIPTTWWEGGAALNGEFGQGWRYDVALHSGLKTDDFNIRSARQKVSEADADDLAGTARLLWRGLAGLELALTGQYQSDITQGDGPEETAATLVETHAIYQRGPLGLRALYARWDLDGDAAELVGRDVQDGWYIEPSWRFGEQLGVFARYNEWDNAAGDDVDSSYSQVDVGVNYWPHPQVVLKADYQWQDAPEGADGFDGFNLGIGYQF